ncbi:MAG: type II secretion system F family protein [Candidatus Bathyarchaeota archaeon]|nr:MAG: type II secretion system F family protein [Candidatus Bathyarchaeota archaeon]
MEEGGLRSRIKKVFQGDSDTKLEAELPYATMMITLMAASGITPYESFKRLRKVDILTKFQDEGEEIVRQVEVLGNDPLTAMEKRADETISRSYAEFLEGYISSVRSGGSIMNYLTSKLKNIFEVQSAKAKNAVERLETLVEAYMVMLIVIFCFYILSTVTSPATMMLGDTGLPDTSEFIYPLVLVVIPIFSLFFMYLANISRPGTLRGIRKPYIVGALPLALFAVIVFASQLVPGLSTITDTFGLPRLVTAGLIVVCIPPAISYHKIARRNFSAEKAMPSFMRDVTEARRTGISPEKSIVHAADRRGYGLFTQDLRRIINQIEWGVSLRKIYTNLTEWIKSWPVIVDFFILVETIEIGGGDANTLGLLAEYSERIQTIEKSQRDMLRPYVVLPFVWTILMAFTITFTLETLSQIPVLAAGAITAPSMNLDLSIGGSIIEAGIVFHSWLSGFFIGKVSEGNFASGFKYAAFLALTSFLTLIFSKGLVSGLFGGMF